MIIILSTIKKIPSNILESSFRKNRNKQIFNWNILDSYWSFQNVYNFLSVYIGNYWEAMKRDSMK